MTHFGLSSYERAFRLPTSFLISGLARLGVKPRLSKSSWRAFASTCPLMLLLLVLLGRLTLLAPLLLGICLPSLYSPLFPLHALASIPPLSRQGAALFALTTWCPEQIALFLFRFGKGGSGVSANCSLCGTEATLSFSAVPVCSSFSAEACAILQALFWSRQHQQVCHFAFSPLWFLLCPRHFVLSSIFPFISNSLEDLTETVFFLLLFY